MPTYLDLQRPFGELIESFPVDVRNQIAKPIDALHLAVDAIGVEDRAWEIEPLNVPGRPAECGQFDSFREPRRCRSKAIASFERPAHRRARVAALAQLDDAFW